MQKFEKNSFQLQLLGVDFEKRWAVLGCVSIKPELLIIVVDYMCASQQNVNGAHHCYLQATYRVRITFQSLIWFAGPTFETGIKLPM
jgi:hypothetical protein